MRTRTTLLVILILLVVAAVVAWRPFNRGPMAFTGGSTVALADYHAADPTGVPADIKNADVVKRGEYLARAADCFACHTVTRDRLFAGGLAIRLPFGTLYSTNITPDKETGIGNYGDQDFLNAVQRAISPHAVSVLHLDDRCRRPGDQSLFVQFAASPRGEYSQHAKFSFQSTMVDDFLVCLLCQRCALHAKHSTKRGVEQRRLCRRGAGALRRMSYAA